MALRLGKVKKSGKSLAVKEGMRVYGAFGRGHIWRWSKWSTSSSRVESVAGGGGGGIGGGRSLLVFLLKCFCTFSLAHNPEGGWQYYKQYKLGFVEV